MALDTDRLRLQAQPEQVVAGLSAGDWQAEIEARIVLAEIIATGSAELLDRVFRALLADAEKEPSP
jgi:hypothetical protein